ncbi:PepSY domain-containing protein [Paenactinomyces guangxiensis]|uniref:PepSY domain-containing protein n=1 Tax=Paenactinomyces guangxiensis TaxID=1490290 RepID=UPI002867C427|nr:PepSY domain-containing protein [Paenactinomyces guangxiensis]
MADLRFKDYGPVAKAISIGIALHEGRYFGWINQFINLLVCIGFIGIAALGPVMWWKRKPKGKLGAPPFPKNFKMVKGVSVITIALGVFFPLVGMSLLLVFLLDWFILRRVPKVRAWIG